MPLEITLPNHLKQHLQTEWGNDLPRQAVEGYRTGVLSLGEVAEMLDLSINDADGILKMRTVLAFEKSKKSKPATERSKNFSHDDCRPPYIAD